MYGFLKEIKANRSLLDTLLEVKAEAEAGGCTSFECARRLCRVCKDEGISVDVSTMQEVLTSPEAIKFMCDNGCN